MDYSYLILSDNVPLKVTLVWFDAPGNSGASVALVNDLDLMVTAPDGTIYDGNDFENGYSRPDTGTKDRLNPVEQILIPHPTNGAWQVTVVGTNVAVSTQAFSLVVTGDLGFSRGSIQMDKPEYGCSSTVTRSEEHTSELQSH